MTQNAMDKSVETFAKYGGLTEREAEAYVWRELRNVRRSETARQMEIGANTVDELVQRAKKKVHLPHIDTVKCQPSTETGFREGLAYEIWFQNEAMLRYVWDEERECIVEETYGANDPQSVLDSHTFNDAEEDIPEYTLATIEEYTRSYRDNPEEWDDWPNVFEAIALW